MRGVEVASFEGPNVEPVAPRRVAAEPFRGVEISEAPVAPRRAADIGQQALSYAVYVGAGSVYGAGVLLDDQGHILTCEHVVEDLQQVEVSFASGARVQARVLERDTALDVALLELEGAVPEGARPAALASASRVRAGDDLFSVGAPRKMPFSLSRGMASFVGRRFEGVRFVQTDLPLNGGSSGGPVIDALGRVVGVASFVLRDSEGIAFALPIDYAVQRFAPWLGAPTADSAVGGPGFEAWLNDLESPR